MSPTEQPDTGSPARPPWRRGRRAAALLAALLVAVSVVAGCSWLTSIGAEGSTGARGADASSADASSAAAAPTATQRAAAEPAGAETAGSSTTTTRPSVTIASGEVFEVASRVTEASVEPGTCGTVAYTPRSASTVQVGELCVPAHQTHTTAIVLVHGGGGTGGSRTDLAAWQQAYAALGYTTFSIDYRLNDPDTDTEVWPAPEQDVKAAVQFVRLASSRLGTDQVVVQGHSAGARLGGVILTTSDDPAFQSGQLWTEASDAVDGFIGFYGYYDGYQFEWDTYYGKGVDRPAESRADANAGRATGPALLITGNADTIVEPSESPDFAAALNASGGDGTAIVLDGRAHGFDLRDGVLTADGHQMVDRIQSWIATHIEAGGSQP